MELVYLWVENYKNIYRQGFNFSPRFKCEFEAEYDENNKLKDNCELIIEKKEYESIFPQNINITAIVGENGSGKSALCELLDRRLINQEVNVVFFNNKKKIFYCQNFNVKQINTNYKIESIKGKDYYDLEDFSININILNSKADGKTDTENDVVLKLSELFQEEHNCFDFLDSRLIFKFWNIKFSNILNSLNTNIKKLDERYEFSNRFISSHEKKEDIYLEIFTFVTIKLILYIINEPLEKSKYFELLKELSENFTKENYLNLVNSITLERLKDFRNYNLILETLQKFDESVLKIEKLTNSKQKINSIKINQFIESGLYKTFHTFSNNNFKSEIIKIDFITENDSHFLNLSSGEQQRINYCLALAHDLITNDEGNKHLLIRCYDEPDVFIHPNWQRLIMSDFLTLIKKYLHNLDQTIHLIITSHSPFILSDLPKENVIFLENGKQIQPFKENEQTFGANIHTLLSHGFFMSDGLMGEFAKSKINEIKKFYDENKDLKKDNSNYQAKKEEFLSKKKDFENIQKIIGEPFLKTIIKNYIDELEEIFDNKTYKNKKKNELLKQFSKEELQKYLDEENAKA